MGAFWLRSDKRLEQCRTHREHSVKPTPRLFPQAIARALQVLHPRCLNPLPSPQPPSKPCNAINSAYQKPPAPTPPPIIYPPPNWHKRWGIGRRRGIRQTLRLEGSS